MFCQKGLLELVIFVFIFATKWQNCADAQCEDTTMAPIAKLLMLDGLIWAIDHVVLMVSLHGTCSQLKRQRLQFPSDSNRGSATACSLLALTRALDREPKVYALHR